MVTKEQMQRGFKLTDQDVRSAVSLILEELLEDRIDKDLRGHRTIRRIRTGPEKEKMCIHIGESENAVARSKTLPSNYRELSNGEFKQKNEPQSPAEVPEVVNLQHIESSGSSADTEESPSIISDKRKKKSFLKRAKERIAFAFRRNPDKENTNAKEANHKSISKTQKGKKNADKGINKSQRHVKEHSGGRSADGAEEGDNVDNDGSVPAESRSVKKWNSNILSSFRRPQKSREEIRDTKLQKNTGSRIHVHENGQNGPEKSVPGRVVPPSTLQVQSGYQGMPSQPQRTLTPQQVGPDSSKQPILQSSGYYQSNDPSVASSHGTPLSLPGESSPSRGNFIFSGSHEISASCNSAQRPDFRFHDLVVHSTQSIRSNVLDSPGEDIDFIDAIEADGRNEYSKGSHSNQVQNSGSQYHVHAGYLKVGRFRKQTVDGSRLTGVEEDPPGVLIQSPDGGAEAATTITNVDEADEEICDELDGVLDEPESSPSSDPGKEAMYCAIAQRLIEMGDSYSSSMSDHKSKSENPESKKELSPLEKDIIDCVRSVGDRITRQSQQDTYHRFQSTVQNSFQGEISWNHLALLFYATKNVVSIVGKGSRAAVLAKDLTVQYVSDSCASWIIDQVGCDFLVSSEESDFGVD